MNLGWKVINVNRGKGLTGAKNKQNNVRLCRICGKPTAGGHLCQTCNDFIGRKKKEERKRAK